VVGAALGSASRGGIERSLASARPSTRAPGSAPNAIHHRPTTDSTGHQGSGSLRPATPQCGGDAPERSGNAPALGVRYQREALLELGDSRLQAVDFSVVRSEEHTSELQSRENIV